MRSDTLVEARSPFIEYAETTAVNSWEIEGCNQSAWSLFKSGKIMSFTVGGEHGGLSVVMCFAFDHRAPFEEVSHFKKALADCPHILVALEVSGTFDYIIQAHLNDLQDYQSHLSRISSSLSKLVKNYETCFVCRTFEATKTTKSGDIYPDTFWIPCTEGFKRVDVAAVNKITAEGDYMRLHLNGETCLMHTTVKSLLEKLDQSIFIQIHRSIIVRRDFILRLLHNDRIWSAYLKDGTTAPISKSHVKEAISRVCGQSRHLTRNSEAAFESARV